MTPTPVFLLTGFLGSGKTTLLARLLRDPALADTAVIVNEYGAVGLDHHLVAQGQEADVVLLDNGCLCCEAGDALGETLTELFHRRARGDVPGFGRVVIETTGMADPGPILASLMADRFMAQRYRVAAVVATVDAEHGSDQLEKHEEVRRQVALADRLVVTKVDRADPAGLVAHLATLNPRADILTAAHGAIDPDRLLAPGDPVPPVRGAHDHGAHAGTIGTVFLPVPDPIGWDDYAAIVRHLQTTLGERLLRAKGLLRVRDEAGLQVVQGVRLLFATPDVLPERDDIATGLVLIGEGLNQERLVVGLQMNGVRPGPVEPRPSPSGEGSGVGASEARFFAPPAPPQPLP